MDTQYTNNAGNNYNMPKDEEMGMMENVDINKMMRLGFIKKVYGILSTQLTLTAGLIALAFQKDINLWLRDIGPLLWVCLGLSLVIGIILVCFKSIARRVPINYILLGVWTFCESFMVATISAFYPPEIVFTAAAMTAAVTIGLTIYACTTKTDFTYCGALLFALSAIMLCYLIFAFAFGFYLNTLYCCFGVLVYSLYLIYDTQLIMGKFGHAFGIDDYVVAALNIYIDIIQIFLYILRILGNRNN